MHEASWSSSVGGPNASGLVWELLVEQRFHREFEWKVKEESVLTDHSGTFCHNCSSSATLTVFSAPEVICFVIYLFLSTMFLVFLLIPIFPLSFIFSAVSNGGKKDVKLFQVCWLQSVDRIKGKKKECVVACKWFSHLSPVHKLISKCHLIPVHSILSFSRCFCCQCFHKLWP